MIYHSNEILTMVNEHLASLPYNRKPTTLYDPIRYVMSLGGKRIRPVLMLMSNNLYSEYPQEILNVACGLETYHNYTLLHDDLMDKADMRRGCPTVHRKWDDNTAILSGDSMLVLAYERMAACKPEKLGEVMRLFTETALEIGEGQQFDMDFEQRVDVREEEYIEMIRLKTSVLLACATKMGALLANAPQADQEQLYKFGEQLGLAFQLQDDYLDVYGDPAVFGKAIGGDIKSNKKTFMLISAFNRATPTQLEELNRWISLKEFDTEEKIKAVTTLYNEMEIDKLSQEKTQSYFNRCLESLAAVDVPAERKAMLTQYVGQLMNRES